MTNPKKEETMEWFENMVGAVESEWGALTDRENKIYAYIKHVIETHNENKKNITLVNLEEDGGPIDRLIKMGNMMFRGPLCDYGKSALVLAEWLRSMGINIVEEDNA